VVTELQQFGEVRRGSIGYVEVAPLTSQVAEQLGVPDARGVLVQRMRRDSTAFRAGVEPGDVIVNFNGTAVTDGSQLNRLIQDASIGSTAAVTVIRDGRRIDLKVPIQSTAQ
jgi:serine protease Do